MNAPALVVQSLTTGDYFRVWPDGRACQVHGEMDLDDADTVDSLHPTRVSTRNFHSVGQGDEWELIERDECPSCEPNKYCHRCDQTGFRYADLGKGISRAELPTISTDLLEAYSPRPLTESADVLAALRGER